jgi:hypothetical protein
LRATDVIEVALDDERLAVLRRRGGYGPPVAAPEAELEARVQTLRAQVLELDAEIAPMAKAVSEASHPEWGLLTRAGNDKSHLARQLERYADIYTSRVANLLYATPFVYLRSPRGSLPHDPIAPGG